MPPGTHTHFKFDLIIIIIIIGLHFFAFLLCPVQQ
jgi:hypothetical protein